MLRQEKRHILVNIYSNTDLCVYMGIYVYIYSSYISKRISAHVLRLISFVQIERSQL